MLGAAAVFALRRPDESRELSLPTPIRHWSTRATTQGRTGMYTARFKGARDLPLMQLVAGELGWAEVAAPDARALDACKVVYLGKTAEQRRWGGAHDYDGLGAGHVVSKFERLHELADKSATERALELARAAGLPRFDACDDDDGAAAAARSSAGFFPRARGGCRASGRRSSARCAPRARRTPPAARRADLHRQAERRLVRRGHLPAPARARPPRRRRRARRRRRGGGRRGGGGRAALRRAAAPARRQEVRPAPVRLGALGRPAPRLPLPRGPRARVRRAVRAAGRGEPRARVRAPHQLLAQPAPRGLRRRDRGRAPARRVPAPAAAASPTRSPARSPASASAPARGTARATPSGSPGSRAVRSASRRRRSRASPRRTRRSRRARRARACARRPCVSSSLAHLSLSGRRRRARARAELTRLTLCALQPELRARARPLPARRAARAERVHGRARRGRGRLAARVPRARARRAAERRRLRAAPDRDQRQPVALGRVRARDRHARRVPPARLAGRRRRQAARARRRAAYRGRGRAPHDADAAALRSYWPVVTAANPIPPALSSLNECRLLYEARGGCRETQS